MPKSIELITFINETAELISRNNPTVNIDMLHEGLQGFYNLNEKNLIRNKRYLTLIDFTILSNTKRLYLIDMESHKTIVNCLVAHGKGSDLDHNGKADSFSNETGSHQSSIGFYITSSTYDGKHKYSLKLIGIDEGYNTNAYARYIVMHSADYVFQQNESDIIGRSLGCPAIPEECLHEVVDRIRDGSCLYIFANDEGYRKKSVFLN